MKGITKRNPSTKYIGEIQGTCAAFGGVSGVSRCWLSSAGGLSIPELGCLECKCCNPHEVGLGKG